MKAFKVPRFYNSYHELTNEHLISRHDLCCYVWWLQIEILWRTDEMRASKPTVLEEIMTGLDYFRYSLFEAVCTTYRFAENSVNVSSFSANYLLFKYFGLAVD